MKKALLIIAIIGACLLVAGGAIFVATMSKNNWDFSEIAGTELEQKTYSVEAEGISGVNIQSGTIEIIYCQVDGESITVDYCTVLNKKGSVVTDYECTVTNGVLTVKEKNYPSFFTTTIGAKVVVKVPKEKVMAVTLQTSTGKLTFGEKGDEISLTKLSLQTSTGRLQVSGNVTCAGEVTLETSTGRLQCEGTINAPSVSMTVTTGRMVISAPIKTSVLRLTASTGDVECAGPIDATETKVETSTGDVELTMEGKKEDYTYTYSASTGKSNVSSYVGGEKTVSVTVSTGDIELSFSK